LRPASRDGPTVRANLARTGEGGGSRKERCGRAAIGFPSRRFGHAASKRENPDVIDLSPTFDDIEAAAERISAAVMNTPCLVSQTLSEIAGCQLHLKFENLQFTASFKERGALNKLLLLDNDQRRAGVCAMSAGNHAQGVAWHAKRLGIPATIVMPEGTPLTKIARTRDHGATVVIAGTGLAEAQERALALTAEGGLAFVHPYDDPAVIAGQGTLGLELLAGVPDLDVIVVPIGGGGLISGMLIAAKQLRPHIEIIGVQTTAYPSMARALDGTNLPCPAGRP
jgi:threonine dehydratase